MDASSVESKNVVLPQITATLVVSFFSLGFGASLVQPAIIVPQLKKVDNFTSDDPISITDNDALWIISIGTISMIGTTVILSFLADNLGRLNTMRLMVLPFIVGQLLMATSTSLRTLLVGRVISMGASVSFPAVAAVYIVETSSPRLRGTLFNITPVIVSMGLLLTYVMGKYLPWRTVAYVLNGYGLVSLGCSMFIPESSYWLALKRKTKRANESARWFGTALPVPVVQKPSKGLCDFRAFLSPTFYKPMVIVTGYYIFQEMSGTNAILANVITFFDDFGTNYDPYTMSIYIGLAKVFVSLFNSWLAAKFCRRSLAMFSFLGMSLSIGGSATFTLLVYNGNASLRWVPPVLLILYIIFLNCGVMFLPYLVSTELWPGNIRGAAQTFSFGVGHLVVFCSFQLYYLMKKSWTSWCIQYFYAASAIGGCLYVYMFLPETHNKTLTEIETYFRSNSNWISNRAVGSQQQEQHSPINKVLR